MTIGPAEQRDILIKLWFDAEKAIGDADVMNAKMQELEASGMPLDQVLRTITTDAKKAGDSLEGAAGSTEKLASAEKQSTTATKSLAQEMSGLGNIGQRVFRSIFGFFVLGVLRSLIQGFSELIDKGRDLARSILDLSVAVRSVQRSGMDIAIAEVTEEIEKLRSEFGLFTEVELRNGISQLLLIGKELNLTKTQLFEIAEATAAAAVVTGTDYDDAISRVARSLSTGYTRGLTDLGFAITEVTIRQEAYSLGLVEVGEKIDANTRTQAIYSQIMKQSGLISEDAAAIQETLVGQYAAEEVAAEQLQQTLGLKLVPAKTLLLKVGIQLLSWIDKAVVSFTQWAAIVGPVVGAAVWTAIEAIIHFWKALSGEGSPMSLDDIKNKYIQIRDVMLEMSIAGVQGVLDPQGLGDTEFGEGFLPSSDELEAEGSEVDDVLKDLFIRFRETIIGGKQDVERENRSFFQDMFEKMQKFIFKMQQLAEKYAFDVQKIWTDYRDKLAEIDIKYREKEIKAEEDFQDKMRKLRNKFLMDLEDALQERDAKQILRLIRNFNAQANELRREKEKEAKDRLREENDEKAALARRRDQRLRDLQLENAFRTKQAQDQYALERKLAWEDHVNKLKEIDIRTQERLEKITRDFKDEHDITEEGAALVTEALNKYFGPSGQIEAIYAGLLASTDNFIVQLAARLRQAQVLGAGFQSSIGGGIIGGGAGGDVGSTNPDQEKIDEIKDRLGGNSGIQSSIFTTPASVLSMSLPSVSSPISQNQRVAVEIGLDENLTGKIIDQTLGEVADVFIKVTK